MEAHKAIYAGNRDLLLQALPEMGIQNLVPPDGAFYVYADVSHLTDDTHVLAKRLLDEAGVAVTPGTDFDEVRGKGYLRFSYARTPEDVQEGLARLKTWLEGLK